MAFSVTINGSVYTNTMFENWAYATSWDNFIQDIATASSSVGTFMDLATENTVAAADYMPLYSDSNTDYRRATASDVVNDIIDVSTINPLRLQVVAAALQGTPGQGEIQIDTGDSNKLKYYDGSSWTDLTAGGGFTPGAADRIPFGNAGGTALTDIAGYTFTGTGVQVTGFDGTAFDANTTAYNHRKCFAGLGIGGAGGIASFQATGLTTGYVLDVICNGATTGGGGLAKFSSTSTSATSDYILISTASTGTAMVFETSDDSTSISMDGAGVATADAVTLALNALTTGHGFSVSSSSASSTTAAALIDLSVTAGSARCINANSTTGTTANLHNSSASVCTYIYNTGSGDSLRLYNTSTSGRALNCYNTGNTSAEAAKIAHTNASTSASIPVLILDHAVSGGGGTAINFVGCDNSSAGTNTTTKYIQIEIAGVAYEITARSIA